MAENEEPKWEKFYGLFIISFIGWIILTLLCAFWSSLLNSWVEEPPTNKTELTASQKKFVLWAQTLKPSKTECEQDFSYREDDRDYGSTEDESWR